MTGMPNFNSIEEVKEFISCTDNVKTIGVISFIDKKGKSIEMRMDEFIEKVGLDNAAKFIYENRDKFTSVETDTKGIYTLLEKFKKDPNSLTEKEKTLLYFLLGDAKKDNLFEVTEIITVLIIKTFLEVGQNGITNNYSGVLAVLLTIMENLFVLSSDLSVYTDNKAVYDEIVKTVTDKIIIPDDIDDTSLFLGLCHIIGERYVGSDLTNGMLVNYRDFASKFGLDEDFLFEDEETIKNNESTDELIEKFRKDLLPDVQKFVGEKGTADISSLKSNTVELDIRQTLKKDKK